MKKVLFWMSFSLLLSLPLRAQDVKADIFGGYQFEHLDVGGTTTNANGWNIAPTFIVQKNFGITADFSGVYKTISGASGHVYTYTFGPTVFVSPEAKVNPFVHALFGGASVGGSINGEGSSSTSGTAIYIGGGVDAKVNKSLSIRAFQFDWLHYSVNGVNGSSNVRICAGAVFHF